MLSRRHFLGVSAVGLVSACAGNRDPAPTFPAFSFKERPILLNVAEITVDNHYTPLGEGHLEVDFDVPPAQALTDWAGDRLQAAGTSGQASVLITEASAIQQSLATAGGISGAFQTDQAWRITVRLAAEIVAHSADGLNTARSSAQVERSTTLPEDVTFTERRQAYYTLTGDAIREFDKLAQASIDRYMGAFRT